VTANLPSGVIFDLDGTLVDSAADVAAILNKVLAEHQQALFSISEVKIMMGHGIRATIEKALKARGRHFDAGVLDRLELEFARLYEKTPLTGTTPYPHAVKVLSALREHGVAVGVCTNKSEAAARLVLAGTGLGDHVAALIAGDSGYGMKPNPEPLQACAKKLGIPLGNIVYVGDHAVDVATARAAAVPVIIAEYGYGGMKLRALGADGAIGCLSELSATLAKITPGYRLCP
jgi:phosphoglycolate phosphatase